MNITVHTHSSSISVYTQAPHADVGTQTPRANRRDPQSVASPQRVHRPANVAAPHTHAGPATIPAVAPVAGCGAATTHVAVPQAVPVGATLSPVAAGGLGLFASPPTSPSLRSVPSSAWASAAGGNDPPPNGEPEQDYGDSESFMLNPRAPSQTYYAFRRVHRPC